MFRLKQALRLLFMSIASYVSSECEYYNYKANHGLHAGCADDILWRMGNQSFLADVLQELQATFGQPVMG